MAIHRIIEANAATHGEVLAIVDAHLRLSYRELNQRANATARHLLVEGFGRGRIAIVCMPRCAETAIVLLGVLKAGGTYVLMDPANAPPQWPRGISTAEKIDGNEIRYHLVNLETMLERAQRSCANLPIVVRSTDAACVIADNHGEPIILVPHATIMALRHTAAPAVTGWSAEAGALDLWAALMSGATVSLNGAALRPAA
jgi:non-ribosomal peptide synthetase component E (peptide arylation enzyme)